MNTSNRILPIKCKRALQRTKASRNQFAHALRYLSVSSFYTSTSEVYRAEIPSYLPMLTHLALAFDGGRPLGCQMVLVDLFESAGRLRSLQLHYGPSHFAYARNVYFLENILAICGQKLDRLDLTLSEGSGELSRMSAVIHSSVPSITTIRLQIGCPAEYMLNLSDWIPDTVINASVHFGVPSSTSLEPMESAINALLTFLANPQHLPKLKRAPHYDWSHGYWNNGIQVEPSW